MESFLEDPCCVWLLLCTLLLGTGKTIINVPEYSETFPQSLLNMKSRHLIYQSKTIKTHLKNNTQNMKPHFIWKQHIFCYLFFFTVCGLSLVFYRVLFLFNSRNCFWFFYCYSLFSFIFTLSLSLFLVTETLKRSIDDLPRMPPAPVLLNHNLEKSLSEAVKFPASPVRDNRALKSSI